MSDLPPEGTSFSLISNTDPNVSDTAIVGRPLQPAHSLNDQSLQMTPQMLPSSLCPGDSDVGRSSGPGGLLPPFGYHQPSHLPTPQSPRHTHLHANGSSPDSPLLHRLRHQTPLVAPIPLSRRPSAPSYDANKPHTPQIITPDSSPLGPHASPPPSPQISPLDPAPTADPLRLPEVDTNPTLLGPAAVISSPRSAHSGETAGRSQLSSPFMEKLSIASRSQRSVSPPALALDPGVPQRDSGPARAESERLHALRLKFLTGQPMLESEAEVEARRPEYLKRKERQGPLSLDDLTSVHNSERLGIADSPIKGRRLQLFQETSDESFEESLMAGGYPRYGRYDVPRTPGKDRSPPLSEHTRAWLQQSTPGPSKVSEPETPVDERLVKKRKRLAAFRSQDMLSGATLPRRKLVPVYVEGKGRVLLDAAPEDGVVEEEKPSKRKKNRRRKLGTAATSMANMTIPSASRQIPTAATGPNWPDSQFPWCVRLQERATLAQAEEEERLRRIAEFLERDSGDEDSDPDEELLPSSAWGQIYELPPKPSRMGRGKMVPLKANPGGRHPVNGNVYLPSGPADAKAALLSKKAVRRLHYRLQHPETEEEDGDTVACICRGRYDGEEAVQCDMCDGWYHLSCVGLRSVEDLGSEDSTWYCPKCRTQEERTPSPDLISSSEPTLVPADDRPAPSTPRDPLFYDASIQESPMTQWKVNQPSTPVRLADAFSFHSSWNADGNKQDPSTPLSQATRNMFATPNWLTSSPPKEPAFDPHSTPSRGTKFEETMLTTPKGSGLGRFGLFYTPGQGRDMGLGGAGARYSGDVWSTPVRESLLNNPDESPVRRSSRGETDGMNLPER